MRNSILLSVLTSVSFSWVVAQTEPVNAIKRVHVSDFYVQPSFFSERTANGTLADFKKLAPQSEYLNLNFAGYNSSDGAINVNSNAMLSVMLGIKFSDKQKSKYKPNPLLRLGISYFSGRTLSNNLYKENRKTYDTLTSSQTGQTIYMDSVFVRSYGMYYVGQQLRLDASLIFRTNPEARWSLFAGVGLTTGFSFSAFTDINYSNYGRSESRSANGTILSTDRNFSSFEAIKTERFNNKTNFGASAFLPMGVDFRMGKKREFWKRMHLYYELRPGINITSIPELRTFTTVSLQHGLGLRVAW